MIRRGLLRGTLAVLVVIWVAGKPSRAHAQPVAVQAQSLFDEGRTLLAARKLAEACAAFEASQKLDSTVSTLLNLADCREQNQQLATAWGAFLEANRMAKASGDAKLAAIATKHAENLKPRLSRLTIQVAADRRPVGLEILRGSDRIDPATWNHALPIDGGTYTFTARAPGRDPWSTTITIRPASDEKTVELPELVQIRKPAATAVTAVPAPVPGPGSNPAAARSLAPAVAPSPAAATGKPVAATSPSQPHPAATGPAAATTDGNPALAASLSQHPANDPAHPAGATAVTSGTTPTEATDSPAWRSRLLPITLGAGALALGGVALGFKISGDGFYGRARAATAQAQRDTLVDSANTRRHLALGAGVAALGCAGTAIYLLVRGGGDDRVSATAVMPVGSRDVAALAVVGRW